jgi:cell division protease FtsH
MGGGAPSECSDATLHAIDGEVCRILTDARARAVQLMTDHRDGLERVARRLLEVETVTGPELRELLADGQAPIPT